MTDANNASNVISEVKRTPLAAMTDLLISTKGALKRPITYITAFNDSKHAPGHVIRLGRRKYTFPAKEVTFPAIFVNSYHFALSLLN